MYMVMKTILVLIAAVVLSASTYATPDSNDKNAKSTSTESVQKVQSVNLSGSVVDIKSNETLVGAAISIDGNKYYSDLEGNFAINNVKPGKHIIKIEFISYQPKEIEIDLQKDQQINVGLNQQ